MSDAPKSPSPNTEAAPKFTERELQLLCLAMQSLKSGPPEIDYEKLAKFAGMSNVRSASNAWAGIKKKLMAPTDGSAPASTPVKRGRKKKDDAGEDGETPTKKVTPRKRAGKKLDEDGETPTKKARVSKAKPKSKSKAESEVEENEDDKVKAEDESAEELKPEELKTEAEEEEEV
ncbi:hypothetical protein E8E13_008027 [Curvularia kusanoi]|uniref:Uncharacterized protein n=1 Tax=Curvularia kusanoi TaxID=90978 RepID=A0A9P4TCW1_CURKU|nr:hypothetical protein E8E13_008027 [Curvularia kusanoi]